MHDKCIRMQDLASPILIVRCKPIAGPGPSDWTESSFWDCTKTLWRVGFVSIDFSSP